MKQHIKWVAPTWVLAIIALQPTLHPQYLSVWGILAATITWYGWILWLCHYSGKDLKKIFGAAGGVLAAMALIYGASSFMVESRVAVAGLHKAKTTTELPSLDIEQVPLVAKEVAHQAMNRKLGEDLGLGSQFEAGEPVKQVLRGKLVWVAPLEPRSILKAWFGDTSPAFVVVSATDASSVEFIKREMRVTARELLDPGTRLWFRNPTLNAYDWFFEVDDANNPYWVAPLTKKEAGVLGMDVAKVAVIDAVTGQIDIYNVDQAPAWVDNVYPAELVESQIDTAGELVKGWFNLTDEGKFELSGTPDQVMVNGQLWHMGTLSSILRSEAITQAVLVNSRTKEILLVELQGITEKAAAKAMETANPEKKLNASNPAIYSVGGVPAYVAALSSEDGVIRAYGVVAANDAQMVAVAETLDIAVKQFQGKRNRTSSLLGQEVEEAVLEGTVQVIRQDVTSGQYYIFIKETRTLVVAAPHISDELHVTEAGDQVQIKVKKAKGASIAIAFKNLSKF